MKTSEEIISGFLKNYRPGQPIDYQDFDECVGITGLSWLERQYKRTKIVSKLNTKLRRGVVIDDKIEYWALWVSDKGKFGSLVIINIGDSLLKESERAFISAASQVDEVMRALAKATGESDYESKVHGRKIAFRGPRPVMTSDIERSAKMHLNTLKLFAPTITTMLGVANQARNFYEESFGPLRITHESQISSSEDSNKAA